MSNVYLSDAAVVLLDQSPPVADIQRQVMISWGFVPAKRDGARVLWELHCWPELHFWLTAQQSDLGLTYIIVISYIAGIRDGRAKEVDIERIRKGLPAEIHEDQERLATFQNIWTQIAAMQRTPQDFAGS